MDSISCIVDFVIVEAGQTVSRGGVVAMDFFFVSVSDFKHSAEYFCRSIPLGGMWHSFFAHP